MGYWKLKDGKMVELIFDDEGKFIKLGGNISEKDAEEIKKEIDDTLKEDNII